MSEDGFTPPPRDVDPIVWERVSINRAEIAKLWQAHKDDRGRLEQLENHQTDMTGPNGRNGRVGRLERDVGELKQGLETAANNHSQLRIEHTKLAVKVGGIVGVVVVAAQVGLRLLTG